jgi:fibronectin-binding autotransporter adhesin
MKNKSLLALCKPSANRSSNLLFAFALSAMLSEQASAATGSTIDWSASAGSVTWATNGNWVLGTAPISDLTTNIARFNQTGYAFQPTATSNGSISGLIFGDGSTSTAATIITTSTGANRLNIGSDGIVMNANSGAVTIGAAGTQGVTLGASQIWKNDSSNLLTVTSLANDADVTPFTLTLSGAGSGGTTVSNIIADGGTTGTTALIVKMTGAGVVSLNGANTFTGGLSIQGGIVKLGNAVGAGAGTVTLGVSGDATSGTLDLNGASRTFKTLLTAGTAANQKITNSAGTAAILLFNGAGTNSDFGGVIENGTGGGTTALTLNNGTAVVSLSGANTFTGLIQIFNGTLKATTVADSGGSALGVASGANTVMVVGNAGNTGTFEYTGTSAATTARQVQIGSGNATLTGGAKIINNNTLTANSLKFTNSNFNQAYAAATEVRVLTLGGTNSGANEIQGAIIDNAAAGNIGVTKANSGTWTLSGANTYSGATIVSEGTLTISGSRNVNAGTINVGGTTAVSSVLNLDNTGSYGTGQIVLGSNGATSSTINQSAGTITSVGGSGLIMGNNTLATNSTYALSGGSLTAVNIIMGTNTATTGTHVTNFNLSGTGALAATTLRIGRYDSAAYNSNNTFSQTGGTATVTNLGLGGRSVDAALTNPIVAALNLTGGTFSATNFASLSAGGANTSTILIGGTAQVTLPAYSGAARGTGSTATITFDTTVGGGGFLAPQVASATYMPAGTFNNAYLSTKGANFKVATGNDITIGQVLENKTGDAGKLTKSDAGKLTLSGVNTYTGATVISGGTLALDATGTIDNTSSVSLGTVGTFDVSAKSSYTVNNLIGSGNVTGALTVSTQLAIGNSTGTVNFSDNLTLDSSAYVYEMTGGLTPGAGSADLGNVVGTLTITSGSILDLVELGTYTVGNKFTLFSYGTLSGTFDGLANNANFLDDLSNTWRIKYDDLDPGDNGGTGTNFVTITAIPEPNAAMLVGGLGVLVLLRRRRDENIFRS